MLARHLRVLPSIDTVLRVVADAARASKEDVLELYANKWRRSVAESCASLAQVLQVADVTPLHRAIQAAWSFTDQVGHIFLP